MRLLGVVLLLAAPAGWSEPAQMEEVVVVADPHVRVFELAETIDIAPDSATILRKAAGASVVQNGPLTGMAQYRGMSRFRVSTQVNGMVISAGGPNWMDPPLSYAPAAHLESLQVYRGIASVSAGLETIGGAVKASTWQGDFSDTGVEVDGRLRTGTQSVNGAALFSAAAAVSNESHLLRVSGLSEFADDAEFSGGEILPSEYERERFDIGYGFRRGAHTFRVDYGRSETGDTGTAALPMDIAYIDADLVNVAWQYDADDVQLLARVHTSDIEHGMTNYHLRSAPGNPGMWRMNIATGDNRGFALAANWGGWRMGLDGHDEVHNSDISNPNNPMFFVTNFNDAQRRLLGVYLERDLALSDDWGAELGLRYNRVTSDSDVVNATPAMMGMPPAVALRDSFNAADREQRDNNIDWVAKLRYRFTDNMDLYAGLSRKTRSPAYQERYLWLPLMATAGLADGRTYTGNIDHDPEVAHEIELGFDWAGQRLQVSPRVFYKRVDDYIQGTASTNTAALMFVQMMNNANGTDNPAPLEFNNVDAEFYGIDMDWSYQLNNQWSLEGVVNLVRGERRDVDDDLYRVAAPNGFVGVHYTRPRWHVGVESFWAAGQNRTSQINGEPPSSGYALLNLQGDITLAQGMRLGFGVDNVFDRNYADHLSGINRVRANPELATGERLPGYGRNFFARIDYSW
ncbi:MAG: TonB-dependent receptor [Pseudomonadales bacterium]|jgi:iron complex outermembrane receptor protein|nr:TonB-dependent receptor [Pseudomonadales bacterium]